MPNVFLFFGDIMSSYSKRFSYNGTVALLCTLSLLSALLSLFISDVFLTMTAAFVAVLMLCERKGKKILSFVIPALIVLMNFGYIILVALYGNSLTFLSLYSIAATEALILGIILYFLFSRNVNKSESVIVMTVVSILFILVNLWLLSASLIGSFSISDAVKFYTDAIASYREIFIDSFTEMIVNAEASYSESFSEIYSEETIASLYDTLISYAPAALIVCAFALVGMLCKIFTFTVNKITGSMRIFEWRFTVKPIFAYAFCALFFINLLFGSIGGVFTVVVSNLYTVFTAVFAYVGFGFACRMFLMRTRRRAPIFILIACLLFAGSIVFNLLAIFAAVTIIIGERRRKQFGDFNSEDRS